MTEYTDKVEEVRLKQKAEKWGRQVKYLHASNGMIETAFNNGDIHYKETKPKGRSWTIYANHSQGTIVEKFRRWLSDVRKS